jgi:predicted sulfurtransferase
VKIRDEIVALGEKVTRSEVDKYHKEITIDEFKKIVDEKNDEYAILDMRNDYEYRLGHFA